MIELTVGEVVFLRDLLQELQERDLDCEEEIEQGLTIVEAVLK